MNTIKDIENIKGKRFLIRVDYNVPTKDGKVIDDFRIKASLPTIEYIQKKGGIIILLAHIGDDGEKSLLPVGNSLKKLVSNFTFINTPIFSDETKILLNHLSNGDVVLLENVRGEFGEKKNSPSFARGISRFGDMYINDAFSVCHRPHASIIGISKHLPSYAGFQLVSEIDNLSKAFEPKQPFLFILGGSKFETKMPLIKKFLRVADYVFIGGALANDFFKGKGYEIGKSLVSSENISIKPFIKNINLILPIDVVVNKENKIRTSSPLEIDGNETIVDIGASSVETLKELINKAKFILWNGPLGKYEDGYGNATEEVLKLISKSNAVSIIGGGDTVSLISKLKIKDKISFVSTGGGATLEFLSKGTLPGIKALK